MNKNNAPKLPSMEHTFDITVTGQETGSTYVGRFKYRRPTLGQRGRIDVMRTRMNGDLENLDSEVKDFNLAVAHLRFTIIDSPDWWQASNGGAELYDGNVVAEVYNQAMAFEAKWKESVFGSEAAKTIAGDPAHAAQQSDGAVS